MGHASARQRPRLSESSYGFQMNLLQISSLEPKREAKVSRAWVAICCAALSRHSTNRRSRPLRRPAIVGANAVLRPAIEGRQLPDSPLSLNVAPPTTWKVSAGRRSKQRLRKIARAPAAILSDQIAVIALRHPIGMESGSRTKGRSKMQRFSEARKSAPTSSFISVVGGR